MHVDDDDPFERAVAREEELRRLVGQGRLRREQARAFGGDDPSALTVAQIRRVVENELDVDLVAAIVRLDLALDVDEILDLLEDYEPDLDFFIALADLQPPARKGDAAALLDNELCPSSIARLRASGLDVSVRDAVSLAEEGADLEELAADIDRYGLAQIDVDALRELVCEGVDLGDLSRLMAAGLDPDDATDLARHGIDPEIVARLGGDVTKLRDDLNRRSLALGLNFKTGTTHRVMGAGKLGITSDGTVRGVWAGMVNIAPGVNADIDATIFGDVTVGEAAEVEISGTVNGDVICDGGQVTVTGTVRGEVRDLLTS